MKRTRYENSNTTTMGPDSLQSIKPVTPDSITEVVLQANNNGSKDPFRQFYLEQVQTIIEKKECSASNLLELLKMSSPNITMEKVINNVNNDREKSLKILKLRIHPDKHPHAPIVATKLFQDVQGFYDKCCDKLHVTVTNGDGGSTVSNTEFPAKFRVQFAWPFLGNEFEPVSGRSVQGQEDLARLMACRCINARGAISHGKPTGLVFDTSDFRESTVESIFQARADGFRTLTTVEEIKLELMTRGPVISTSFRLSEGFADSKNSHSNTSFLLSRIGDTHPLLIVGWKFTKFGDVWVVNHLDYNLEHMIAFGHFDIDKRCIAPMRSFEHDSWQAGPYFRFDFSNNPTWRDNESFAMLMPSSRLELLAACFDNAGLHEVIDNNVHFELCDQTKMAHSRTCVLKELTWDSNANLWKVFVEFTD